MTVNSQNLEFQVRILAPQPRKIIKTTKLFGSFYYRVARQRQAIILRESRDEIPSISFCGTACIMSEYVLRLRLRKSK